MSLFDITLENPALKRTVINEARSDEESSDAAETGTRDAGESSDVAADASSGGGGGGGRVLVRLLLLGGVVLGAGLAVRRVVRAVRGRGDDGSPHIAIEDEAGEESTTAD